jgi:hypothetical protein
MAPSSPSVLGGTSRLEGPLTPTGGYRPGGARPQLGTRISVSIKREFRWAPDISADRPLPERWISHDFDRAAGSGSPRQAGVRGDERRLHNLGQSDVERIPGAHGLPELPNPVEERTVGEALPWPIAKILNGLCGRRYVEPAGEVVPSDYADHLDVDDRWSRMVSVESKARSNIVGPRRVRDDLVERRRVNDQHEATRRATRRAPRGHPHARSVTVGGSSVPATPPRWGAPRAAWPPDAVVRGP